MEIYFLLKPRNFLTGLMKNCWKVIYLKFFNGDSPFCARKELEEFMFVLGNFVDALASVVSILLTIMYWLILIRALISWVNPDPFNPLVQFLMRITEPVLEPVRRLLPPLPIDISPIIVFFIIMFLQRFLVTSLYDLAMRLAIVNLACQKSKVKV